MSLHSDKKSDLSESSANRTTDESSPDRVDLFEPGVGILTGIVLIALVLIARVGRHHD